MTATPQLMLYGATGYSLGLAAKEAKRSNLPFIIGGRNASKVKALASSLDVPYRVFSPIDDAPQVIDEALRGVKLLASGAGPFSATTGAFMDACIRNGVHYMDISAELHSFQAAKDKDEQAKANGVMLLPTACSGVECVLDCVAARLLDKVTSPAKQLEQILNINGPVSRGTLATIRGFPGQAVKLVDGQQVPHGSGAPFDFRDGRGEHACFPSNDPQMITLAKAKGLQDFVSYCAKTGGDFPGDAIEQVPEGPSRSERDQATYHAGFVVTGADGSQVRAVVHMANGYDLTALGTVEAARRILEGRVDIKPGFQTPYLVFGGDYPEVFPGTTVEEY